MNSQLNLTTRFGAVPASTIDSPHSNPTRLNAKSIKVLSWNINKNNHTANWIADFSEIVTQYQPDKIFLQEVQLSVASQKIPELMQMSWSFAPNFIDKLTNVYSGVLIATRDNHLNAQAVITQHSEPITKHAQSLSVCRILTRSQPGEFTSRQHSSNQLCRPEQISIPACRSRGRYCWAFRQDYLLRRFQHLESR